MRNDLDHGESGLSDERFFAWRVALFVCTLFSEALGSLSFFTTSFSPAVFDQMTFSLAFGIGSRKGVHLRADDDH